MAIEPEVYTLTRWGCPVCQQKFASEEECVGHIEYYHESPSPEVLALIGRYIMYESAYGNRIIILASDVTHLTRVHGPALQMDEDSSASIMGEYWIDVARARYTVLDVEEARALWDSWCHEAIRTLESRYKGIWELLHTRVTP